MAIEELTENGSERPEEIKAVPVRRPGRWIAAIIVLVISASVIRFVVTDSAIEWHVVGHFMFNSLILHGVLYTMLVSVLAMALGIILGVIAAVMRLSPNPILKSVSWLYIFFFRGTPLLVQIVFWFNIEALFPHSIISIGIPFGPGLIHPDANAIISVFVAALLGLGVNEGSYMAEIVRAGIISVPEGQGEAAASLGMSRTQIMRKIILPQAMRVILPPTGNEFIGMLKNSSLASEIAFTELFFEGSAIYSTNFKTIQLLIVESVWYLAMTTVLYVFQYFLERKYGQGFSRKQTVSIRERWFGSPVRSLLAGADSYHR